MKNIFSLALRRFGDFVAWVSPLDRLFAFLLGLVFVVSLASWALAVRETGYVLYFPSAHGGALRGESRDMPRRTGVEAKARELVAEFLLGPANPGLLPAFPAGTPLNAVLFRKGVLFVDIGPEAALLPEDDLKLAIRALQRTIGLGIHQARKVVITIGGLEPWRAGLSAIPATVPKKP